MSQFTWESEVADEPHGEPQLEFDSERQPELQLQEPMPEPGTLVLSPDDFLALEERIVRAVNLVKRERMARTAAEERAAQAEAKLREQAPQAEQLQREVNALRAERDHVRQRVERLLKQLDALEL